MHFAVLALVLGLKEGLACDRVRGSTIARVRVKGRLGLRQGLLEGLAY